MPPACKYALCLDDDVAPHADLLADLVATLEADPDAFMATGYPFDVPDPGARLGAYCILAYHLPLIIAFSLGLRTRNVWGGCMLLRTTALQRDEHGLLQVRSRSAPPPWHALRVGTLDSQ